MRDAEKYSWADPYRTDTPLSWRTSLGWILGLNLAVWAAIALAVKAFAWALKP